MQTNRMENKEVVIVLFFFIFAFLIRLFCFSAFVQSDLFPFIKHSDSHAYYLWAKDISSGSVIGTTAFMKWPLYAYLLALFLKIFKDNLAYVYIIQYLWGAFSCVLVYLLGRLFFNRRVGFLSAGLFLLFGLTIFYESLLVYTSLSLWLNLFSLLCLFLLQKNLPKKNVFLLGLLLGFAALAQGSILPFALMAIFWLLSRLKNFKERFILFGFFSCGLFSVLGLSFFHNLLAEKDNVLIAGNLGLNFYLGNNPESKGTFYYPKEFVPNQEGMFRDARILAEQQQGRRLKTSEISSFWFKKGLDFLRKEPKRFSLLFLRKLMLIFSPKEFTHDIEIFSYKNIGHLQRWLFYDLHYLFCFALLGIFWNLKKIKELGLLYIYLVGVSFSIALFFVSSRYRISLFPVIAIFAGSGIEILLRACKKKKLLFIFFAFLFIILSICLYLQVSLNKKEKYQESRSFSERLLVQSAEYERNKNYLLALKTLSIADKFHPSFYNSFRQGVIYYHLGEFDKSEEKFKEALLRNPLSVDSLYNLGLLYNQKSRFSEAQVILENAILLDPKFMEAYFELGIACKNLHNYQKAKLAFKRTLDLLPRWRTEERQWVLRELAQLNDEK